LNPPPEISPGEPPSCAPDTGLVFVSLMPSSSRPQSFSKLAESLPRTLDGPTSG
jgi:hypothetical protein